MELFLQWNADIRLLVFDDVCIVALHKLISFYPPFRKHVQELESGEVCGPSSPTWRVKAYTNISRAWARDNSMARHLKRRVLQHRSIWLNILYSIGK